MNSVDDVLDLVNELREIYLQKSIRLLDRIGEKSRPNSVKEKMCDRLRALRDYESKLENAARYLEDLSKAVNEVAR